MKFKSTLNLLFLFAFGAFQLNAQNVNLLTITAPASIAGEYDIVVAPDWGGTIADGTMASFQLMNDNMDTTTDACDGTPNPFVDTWAFIDRGNCEFATKALNAQNAGAVGAFICNNLDGDGFPGLGGGVDSDFVTIGVAGMTKEDCDLIRVVLTETEFIEGTFSFFLSPCEDDVVYGPETVWGMNGEGEFDGGLGAWETEGFTSPDHVWEWSADELSGNGWQTLIPLTSESICNGAAVFDYVGYNTTQTSGVANATEGLLTSPSIDLSAGDFPIVKFTQANLPLNSSSFGGGEAGSYLAYSIDDGATWSDPIQIPTANIWTSVTQDIFGVEEVEIPIPDAANQTNVKIRFGANGDFYYWMIDDVSILSIEKTEVQANINFAAGPQNFRTPVSQVEDLAFLMDVENTGNATVNNVNLNVTVRDGITTLYEDQLSYGDIAGGFLDENKAFPNQFQMPAVVSDAYSLTYELTADNDLDDTNNSTTKNFEVTEDTYAKVLPAVEGGSVGGIFISGEPYTSIGVAYHVPNGDGYYVKDVRFGLGNASTDVYTGIINFSFYEWLDLNEDGAVDGDERLLLGFRDLPISSSLGEDYSDISIGFMPADGGDFIELGDDKQYVIVAHMNPFNPAVDPEYQTMATSDDDSEYNYHYFAMNFARDTLDLSPRYGSFSATGDDGSEIDRENRVFDQFYNFSVYMPMTIGMISGVDDINEEVMISAFPNPTSDQLFIDLSLEDVAENVTVELVNIEGKLAYKQLKSNIQRDRLELNTSNLAPGIYMLNVRTDFGINSQKILIER